jgi:hypothetical protein
MLAMMKTPLYSTTILLHNLFARYVQVSFIWSWFNVPQAARKLQVCLNTQRNLSQNLQRKFDDISNTPQDGDDDSPATSPAKKRRRTQEDNLDDDQPSVEDADLDEVKRLGRQFVILHGPWLRRKEHIFQVELDEEYDEKDRFKDTNTLVQSQLCEIRRLLPDKYLGDAFTKRWLPKSVSNVYFLCE